MNEPPMTPDAKTNLPLFAAIGRFDGRHAFLDVPSALLSFIALAAVIAVSLHWLGPTNTLLWLVFSLMTAAPGWALGLLFGPRHWRRRFEFWIGAALLGWAISSYILLVAGYLSGFVQQWPVWAIGVLSAIGILAGWRHSDREDCPASRKWEVAEFRILTLALVMVAVFISRPFLQVGSLTPDGYAFPWLFGFDFTNRVSIAANAAVGLPLEFFHIHGEKFHYYLLTYMIPVAFKQFSGGTVQMYGALVMWCVNLALAFAVLFVAVMRLITKNARALLHTILTVFIGYSYYWMYVAAKTYAETRPAEFPATLNGGAWMTYSNVSHLLYRYFLVEPQTILGMAILLPVLMYFIAQQGRLKHLSAGIGIGLAVGLVFGADVLLAAWALLGLGIVAIADLGYARGEFRRRLAAWAVMAFCFCAMAYGYYLIGMYATAGSRSLVLGLHGSFAKIFPLFMFVEFGPLLVLGVLGGIHLLRGRAPGHLVWWVLTLAAVCTVLCIQAQYDDQLGLLKGSRFLFILFALGAGVFWQKFTSRTQTQVSKIAVIVLLMAAIPTWATDWLCTSNTADRRETVYIQPADYRACQWIKDSLPPDAVVQSSPGYTNYLFGDGESPYLSPLIANFAERPMAVGCWGMPQMIPNIQVKFNRILADVHSMFAATDVDSIMTCVDRYDIEYVYYGPLERKRWPTFETVLRAYPQRFMKEYDRDHVGIYRIVR